MNEKARINVRKLGFCCLYAYFQANPKITEVVAASQLRVTPRTIRSWRAKLRVGELKCQSLTPCFLQKIQAVADKHLEGTSAPLSTPPLPQWHPDDD